MSLASLWLLGASPFVASNASWDKVEERLEVVGHNPQLLRLLVEDLSEKELLRLFRKAEILKSKAKIKADRLAAFVEGNLPRLLGLLNNARNRKRLSKDIVIGWLVQQQQSVMEQATEGTHAVLWSTYWTNTRDTHDWRSGLFCFLTSQSMVTAPPAYLERRFLQCLEQWESCILPSAHLRQWNRWYLGAVLSWKLQHITELLQATREPWTSLLHSWSELYPNRDNSAETTEPQDEERFQKNPDWSALQSLQEQWKESSILLAKAQTLVEETEKRLELEWGDLKTILSALQWDDVHQGEEGTVLAQRAEELFSQCESRLQELWEEVEQNPDSVRLETMATLTPHLLPEPRPGDLRQLLAEQSRLEEARPWPEFPDTLFGEAPLLHALSVVLEEPTKAEHAPLWETIEDHLSYRFVAGFRSTVARPLTERLSETAATLPMPEPLTTVTKTKAIESVEDETESDSKEVSSGSQEETSNQEKQESEGLSDSETLEEVEETHSETRLALEMEQEEHLEEEFVEELAALLEEEVGMVSSEVLSEEVVETQSDSSEEEGTEQNEDDLAPASSQEGMESAVEDQHRFSVLTAGELRALVKDALHPGAPALVLSQQVVLEEQQRRWLSRGQLLRSFVLASHVEKQGWNWHYETSDSWIPSWLCWIAMTVEEQQVELLESSGVSFVSQWYELPTESTIPTRFLLLWLGLGLMKEDISSSMRLAGALPSSNWEELLPESSGLVSFCLNKLVLPAQNGLRPQVAASQPPEHLEEAFRQELKEAGKIVEPARLHNFHKTVVKHYWRTLTQAHGVTATMLEAVAHGETPEQLSMTPLELAGTVEGWKQIVAQYRNNILNRLQTFLTRLREARRLYLAWQARLQLSPNILTSQDLKQALQAVEEELPLHQQQQTPLCFVMEKWAEQLKASIAEENEPCN